MPSQQDHLKKAVKNDALAATLERGEYRDWAATVMFYAALHYVDAVLAATNVHPLRHNSRRLNTGDEAIGRDDCVAKHFQLRKIHSEYQALKTTSNNARYFAVEVTPEKLHDCRQDFDTIKAYISGLLHLPNQLA